ncbi:MAG: hypothetical protein D9V45_02890 [Chloroflexi bacterium]|nr:MAG: hypothetical protein D9V45_02890 [Chloroflexota bacterium]
MSQERSSQIRKRRFWIVIAILVVGLVFLFQSHIIPRILSDVVYDNYDHYLPCERLPLATEVEAVVADHTGTVNQIQAISPDVRFSLEKHVCGGADHADIVIYYPTHAHREQIETILGGKTFFGTPARWINY